MPLYSGKKPQDKLSCHFYGRENPVKLMTLIQGVYKTTEFMSLLFDKNLIVS